MSLDYGREIVSTSYHAGEVRLVTREVEQSILVTDKAHLLQEILAGLELIDSGKTTKLTLEVHGGTQLRIVKRYVKPDTGSK